MGKSQKDWRIASLAPKKEAVSKDWMYFRPFLALRFVWRRRDDGRKEEGVIVLIFCFRGDVGLVDIFWRECVVVFVVVVVVLEEPNSADKGGIRPWVVLCCNRPSDIVGDDCSAKTHLKCNSDTVMKNSTRAILDRLEVVDGLG
mmetsp:Transcript_36156/g.48469  ORF Transcript_36156/g.48469 Transcript_36156/m.48469 type:complete len:144 (+) Transcript_36156:642-1073(+)